MECNIIDKDTLEVVDRTLYNRQFLTDEIAKLEIQSQEIASVASKPFDDRITEYKEILVELDKET